MASTVPHEIILAPFEVWLAIVGSAFTDLDDVPSSPWVRLGTSGSKSMAVGGVTVQHPRTQSMIRTYGSTGPVKSTITDEDLLIGFTLIDLKLEEYTRIINNGTVTQTAAGSGTAGIKDIDLLCGLDPTQRAIDVRASVSPEGVGSGAWKMAYQVPKVVATGSPSVAYTKTDGAGLTFEFQAIEDLTASAGEEFGKLIVQNADAT